MRPTLNLAVVGVVDALILDQTSKMIVVDYASELSSGLPVFPVFNLVNHRDDGVTFDLLNGAPWWGLAIMTTVVCLWLIVLMLRTKEEGEAVAYGLIIGGAVGKVIDRIRVGTNTDFLDFFCLGAALASLQPRRHRCFLRCRPSTDLAGVE